jgi:hypothetical protein
MIVDELKIGDYIIEAVSCLNVHLKCCVGLILGVERLPDNITRTDHLFRVSLLYPDSTIKEYDLYSTDNITLIEFNSDIS